MQRKVEKKKNYVSPASSRMDRLPQVFVFDVGADVVIKQEVDHLDVAVGGGHVKLQI